MNNFLESISMLIFGDSNAERLVPPTGFTVRLTIIAAAAMGFLATFALIFAAAAGTLADRWSTDLDQTATIRVNAPETQMNAQLQTVMEILRTTPGVKSHRIITLEEQQALLEPWFGKDMVLDQITIPKLIEVIETQEGVDPRNLQLRLSAEAPGAIFDDHGRWRKPLVGAANRLRLLGTTSVLLIGLTLAVIVTLAAQSALAANHQVIRVLRLIGARDSYIAQAFVRRFTLRTLLGAAMGVAFAILIVAITPSPEDETGFLTGLQPSNLTLAWLLIVPIMSAIVAFIATRIAATRSLKELR